MGDDFGRVSTKLSTGFVENAQGQLVSSVHLILQHAKKLYTVFEMASGCFVKSFLVPLFLAGKFCKSFKKKE